MRLVRHVALTLVVATVYFAQYLFDTTSLANFFPSWLSARWPLLATVARWLPADLVELAVWRLARLVVGGAGIAAVGTWLHRRSGLAATAKRYGSLDRWFLDWEPSALCPGWAGSESSAPTRGLWR